MKDVSSGERVDDQLEPTPWPRRNILKLLGTAGAGVIAGVSPVEARSEETQETRIFRNGDVIENHAMTCEIDGWYLRFDWSKIREIQSGKTPNRTNNSRYWTCIAEGGVCKGPIDERYVRADSGRIKTDSLDRLRILPLGQDGTMTLVFEEKEGYRTIRKLSYPIVRPVFSSDVRSNQQIKSLRCAPNGVFSEVPVESEKLKEMNDMVETFDQLYDAGYPVYLYRVLHDKAQFENMNGRIEMSASYLEPGRDTDRMSTLYHELAHALYFRSRLWKGDHPDSTVHSLAGNINREFQNWLNVGKYSGDSALSDTICILKESTYSESECSPTLFSSRAGHPYDNENELFASALSVLRYFPREFSQRYKNLRPEGKKVVQNVSESIFSFLEHTAKRKDAVTQLLPDYQTIKTVLS